MSLNLLHDITPGDDVPNKITVVVEIPKGSKNKYELDKKTGLIKLDRVMKTSQDYPFDYGFVPQTHWHDGDPLDVVIITTYPLIPNILIDVRPVAVMDMIDHGESDAKIIAVPCEDPRFDNVNDLADINPHFIKEVTHFFTTYKTMQDKVVTIEDVHGKDEALQIVTQAIEMYKKKNNK